MIRLPKTSRGKTTIENFHAAEVLEKYQVTPPQIIELKALMGAVSYTHLDVYKRQDKDWYGTIPLGIIVTDKMIFTVCLEDTQVLTRFMEGRVRNFFTYMKTRFILQILYRNSSMYLRYLRIIDKKSEQVEEKLHFSPRNQELIELLELEK